MKQKLGKLFLAGAALLVVAGVLLSAFLSGPLAVEVITVEAADAQVTYTGQGTVVYESELDLTAPVSGEVVELLVSEGQQLREGDPVAVIHAPDVAYQIQRLEANIRAYQAQINDLSLSEQKSQDILAGTRGELEGQLTALEAERTGRENADSTLEYRVALQENIVAQDLENLGIARRELYNYRDDYGSDTSDPEYNALRTAVNEAEKALNASRQVLAELEGGGVETGYFEGQMESVRAQIDSIDVQLSGSYGAGMRDYYSAQIQSAQVSIQELREQQGRATITAPCDSVVSVLEIREGARLNQGDAVAVLGRTPLVEVLVPVRELDGIGEGDEVTLTASKRTGDQILAGTVRQIAGQAQVELSPLGVEESKVRVLIAAQGELPVGSQVEAAFTVFRQEHCITVPAKAVFQIEDGDAVWVIRDELAQIQPIVKATEVRGGYIVSEGLQEGDLVVADANQQGLSEGGKVAAS